MIVRLSLLGGDLALDQELRSALAGLPEVALLAPERSGDADVLLAATPRSRRRATSCGASALVAGRRASC